MIQVEIPHGNTSVGIRLFHTQVPDMPNPQNDSGANGSIETQIVHRKNRNVFSPERIHEGQLNSTTILS